MYKSRWFAAFSLTLLIAFFTCNALLKRGRRICEDSTDQLCSLNRPNLDNQTSLNEFGWTLLQKIAGHGDSIDHNYAAPQWESGATKCDLHLMTSICDHPTLFKVGVEPENKKEQHLVSSMVIAVQQDLSDPSWKSEPLAQPQLASVLYNKIAAQAISDRLKRFPAQGAIAKLPAGSMIAKAIWALISVDQPPVLFVTKTTPNSERNWDPNVPIFPYPSADDTTFFLPVNVDTAPAKACLGASTSSLPPVISGQCVHLYRNMVRPGTSEEGDEFMYRCKPTCSVVLVGLQLMVRTQENRDWVWIGMWYTGRDNGRLEAPWKYYTIDVTNRPRSSLIDNRPNIVFNPYLEGVMTFTNGAQANCLNCHSYAAFDSQNNVRMAAGLDVKHGDPPVTAGNIGLKDVPPFDLKEPGDYLQHGVQTDFIWSVAGKEPIAMQTKTSKHAP